MGNVAVITARGGSKRIPRKNIKEFLGKPIMAYAIEAALQSGVFEEVMVSTDDEEIAEIGKQYGAVVPFFRSAETSNDFATTMDVLQEVVREYEKRGRKFDFLACLYPTAPFVTAQKLRDAIKMLKEKGADVLYPVARFPSPPQRARVIDADGYIDYQYPEYRTARSQDLEPIYYDVGQFYIHRVSRMLLPYQQRKAIPLIVPGEEVQDIDDEGDWKMAEVKYRRFILGEDN